MTKTLQNSFKLLADEHRDTHRQHWDAVVLRTLKHKGWGGYYHRRLQEVFRFHIPPGSHILEIGSGTGDLLASLSPAFGVGIDFSYQAVIHSKR